MIHLLVTRLIKIANLFIQHAKEVTIRHSKITVGTVGGGGISLQSVIRTSSTWTAAFQ